MRYVQQVPVHAMMMDNVLDFTVGLVQLLLWENREVQEKLEPFTKFLHTVYINSAEKWNLASASESRGAEITADVKNKHFWCSNLMSLILFDTKSKIWLSNEAAHDETTRAAVNTKKQCQVYASKTGHTICINPIKMKKEILFKTALFLLYILYVNIHSSLTTLVNITSSVLVMGDSTVDTVSTQSGPSAVTGRGHASSGCVLTDAVLQSQTDFITAV